MNTKKIFTTLIAINVSQIVLTIIMVVMMLNKEEAIWDILAYVAIVFTVFNGFITVLAYNVINRAKNVNLIESIRNLEQLNSTLRMQRHDYLNHLQVVYGLLELKEYDEAVKYLEPVFEAVKKVNLAMKTSQPAVNALIQAKMQAAEKQGIKMYLNITADLKDLNIEPWELCKVLANIIDNGITALSYQKNDITKEIHINMEQECKKYIIEIMNNGPVIPKEKREKIFEQGYSTKKEEGHGMGLYIVWQILNQVGGSITVKSSEKETVFTILLDRIQHVK